jgi:hypothetical protein
MVGYAHQRREFNGGVELGAVLMETFKRPRLLADDDVYVNDYNLRPPKTVCNVFCPSWDPQTPARYRSKEGGRARK